ncbi:MAG: response regulator [Rudaea sp.]
MDPLRILLVDDHALFRKGLAGLISSRPDMTVVAEAGNGREAIERAREAMPDLILMDIVMPEVDGLEATRVIKQELPLVRIVMLTASDEDVNLFAALKNGADGYLLKILEPPQLFAMIDGIRRGESPISGSLASRILNEFRRPEREAQPSADYVERLTPRDNEVLELIVQGLSNKEIAERLNITENTVKLHLRNILEKLHLQNRIQVAVYAVRRGLVSDSSEPPYPNG